MKAVKIVALTLLTLLAVIIVLQNTEPVSTKVLFWTFTIPRALLLLLTTLIGFVLGLIVSFLIGRKGG